MTSTWFFSDASARRSLNRHTSRMKTTIVLLIITTTVLGPLTPAKAAPITLTYNGTLVAGDQANSFNIGDPFHVTFTFESSTPDTSPDPTVGQYAAVTTLSFTVGSYSGFLTTPAPIQVGNDYTAQGGSKDYFNILSFGSAVHGPAVGDRTPSQFILQFEDITHTAFGSDALLRDDATLVQLTDL